MTMPQREAQATDTWLTPRKILDPLGEFDLDPASPIENRNWTGAKKTYTELENGLVQHWEGRVWLNPPYGRGIDRWMRKMSEHVKNGGAGIAFIFARTDTSYWHKHIFPVAKGALFLAGRTKFFDSNGVEGKHAAPAPSVLIAYTYSDLDILESSGLNGKVVRF